MLCLKVVIEDGGLTFWGSGPERVQASVTVPSGAFILPRQLSCVHLAFPNSPFHRVPSPVLILSQKSSDRFTARQNSVIVTHSGLTDSRDSVK